MTNATRLQALEDLREKVEAGRSFDGSLDAAKALHEAVLPKYYWRVSEFDGAWTAEILGTKWKATSEENPARAWLLAILSALIAMEEDQ